MSMKVEIAFDLSANGQGNFLTLDDSVKGKLNSTTYVLSGETLVDVTDKVRRLSSQRGRSRVLEQFTAGVCTIDLSNQDRSFDPLYAAGPYYGQITPRRQVRVSRDGEPVFTGNVEQWSWSYDLGGDSVATVQAVDGFATLSQVYLTPAAQTAQLTGARVSSVLDQAAWPNANRRISTGGASLGADVVPQDTTAISYLQQVSLSEPGAFFMARDGFATFLDRGDLADYTTGGVTFGPSGIPFVEYEAASLTDELRNLVSVTWRSGSSVGGTATAQDLTSQAQFGVFDATYDTLLANSTDASALASWLVNQYAAPKYRIDSVTVALHGLSDPDALTVLGLELGDVITVAWTPSNVGPAISQIVTIDGIRHEVLPDSHFVTFRLSETVAAFILDDSVFGVLDANVLGF